MNAPVFDIHPDMRDLLAAKQVVTQASDARTGWNAYGASLARPYPEGMVVRDLTLNCPGAGTNGAVRARHYRPAGLATPAPCVVYLHGGAFQKGGLDSADSVAWGIADEVGAIVVSVEYRLAPEHRFPAPVEDCYAAVKHLAEHADAHGIDPDRIAVWGDSAGGNLATCICIMARDRGGPKIVAQALNYAPFTDEATADSYRRYNGAPGAVTGSSWDAYLGPQRPTRNPYAAPLKAEDLSNLPPAHVHFAEIDSLADDSRAYAQRLRAAGNVVVLRCAERMIHGFLRARFTGPAAAAEFAAPCEFLRHAFSGQPWPPS